MKYISPYNIISKNDFQSYSKDGLKKLRKKILLEFDLIDGNTILKNDVSYDKNSVLAVFASLEENWDVYKKIATLPKLKNFLEKEEFSFFIYLEELAIIRQDLKIGDKICSLINKKVLERFTKLMLDSKYEHYNVIDGIIKYISTQEPSIQQEIYSKLFLNLEVLIEDLNKIDNPFKEGYKYRFIDDIYQYVNESFVIKFLMLPSKFFKKHQMTFGIWCNNIIVVKAAPIDVMVDLDLNGLKSLKSAAMIASKFHNERGNLEIVGRCNEQIKNFKLNKRIRIGGYTFLVSIVILLIYVFGQAASKDNYYYGYDQNEIVYFTDDIEKESLLMGKIVDAIRRNPDYQYSISISGESSHSLKAELIEIVEKKNTYEFYYHVNLFPSKVTGLSALVTRQLEKCDNKKIKNFKLILVDKDFDDRLSSHLFKKDDNTESLKYISVALNPADTLSIKKVSVQDLNLDAVVSTVDRTVAVYFKEQKLRISYDEQDNTFRGDFLDHGTSHKLSMSEIDLNLETVKIDQANKIRLGAIINNLTRIHPGSIKSDSAYTKNKVASYSLLKFEKGKGEMANSKYFFGRLELRFISAEDNTAVFTLYSEDCVIHYFVDNITMEIKSVTMLFKRAAKHNSEIIKIHLN